MNVKTGAILARSTGPVPTPTTHGRLDDQMQTILDQADALTADDID